MELTQYTPRFFNPSRLFYPFFREDPFEKLPRSGQQSLPSINLHESEKAYEIEVAAPGLKKENFSISEEDSLLCISCKVEKHKKEKEKELLHEEFSYLSWSRHIQLPQAQIDIAKTKANYSEGILSIQVPKRREAISTQKKISVE